MQLQLKKSEAYKFHTLRQINTVCMERQLIVKTLEKPESFELWLTSA